MSSDKCECGFYDRDRHHTKIGGGECEYFGPTSFCLRCGREWQEGEWMELPFIRQSRQKNIAYAKKHWRAIGPAARAPY